MITTQKVRTGVRNLYVAVLNSDTVDSLAYETPIRVPGLIRVDVNPGSNIDTLYADNKAAIVYSTVGSVEVTLEKDSLPDDLLSLLLGRPTDAGVTYVTNTNSAPYVALMFEQTYSNGSSSYVKLYKGKFTEPDVSNETKNDSVNFQTGEITGQFVATNFEKTFAGGRVESLVMSTADEDSENYTNEGDTWFDYVYQEPTELTVTSSVSDGDADVTTTASITLTSNNAMLESYVLDSGKIFILEDGVGVHESSLSLNTDATELTIDPDTDLASATSYTLVYKVKDVYGQETDSEIVNFTTV